MRLAIWSMRQDMKWDIGEIEIDGDSDPLPTILITAGKRQLRLFSVPSREDIVADMLEPYAARIQPKDIKAVTKANLDLKTLRVLEKWEREHTVNADLSVEERELKLFILATPFIRECQQLGRYPSGSKVSELLARHLDGG